MAPSQLVTASFAWLKHCLVAWDKRERLGEAKNPGPEPSPGDLAPQKERPKGPPTLVHPEWRMGLEYALCPPTPSGQATNSHEALRNW